MTCPATSHHGVPGQHEEVEGAGTPRKMGERKGTPAGKCKRRSRTAARGRAQLGESAQLPLQLPLPKPRADSPEPLCQEAVCNT